METFARHHIVILKLKIHLSKSLSFYLLTYFLTPWCWVLLEKLTGLQLVKKFPTFHGTRKFITALTSVRQLSLSWASPIQYIYPHPTSWRSILILSTHLCLGLPSGLLPSGFPTKTLYTPSPHPYAPHAQPISFFILLQTLIPRHNLRSSLKWLDCSHACGIVIVFRWLFSTQVTRGLVTFRRTIVLVQHVVSSLSLGDCSVHRLREDWKPSGGQLH